MPCDNAQRYKDLLKIYKEHSSQLQTHASECLLEISPRPLKLDMANAKLFFFWYSFLPFLSCPKWFPSFALPVSVHILSSIQCPSHKNIVNFSSGFSPCSSNPSLHHHSLVQATFISPWGTAFHGSPSFHSRQHCNPARELWSILYSSLDGKGIWGEIIHVFVWLRHSAVHQKLSQHC